MNANDGVGALQVADGALSQVTTLLNRAVTLATESSTGTVSDQQRTAIQAEFSQIQSEIDSIGQSTEFNGTSVFCANTTSIFLSDGNAAANTTIAVSVGTFVGRTRPDSQRRPQHLDRRADSTRSHHHGHQHRCGRSRYDRCERQPVAGLGKRRKQRSAEPDVRRRPDHERRRRDGCVEPVEVQHARADWYCGGVASQLVSAESVKLLQ